MKKFHISLTLLYTFVLFFSAITLTAAADFDNIKLADEIKIPDFSIARHAVSKLIKLPGLPVKTGFIPVLKCRMYSYHPSDGGCNRAVKIAVNGTEIGARTSTGRQRLLLRNDFFYLKAKQYRHIKMRVFPRATEITLQYGPTAAKAGQHTTDNKADQFIFDLSDVVRDVDVNMISFTNIRAAIGNNITLFVQDASIGYLDRKLLQEKETPLLNCRPSSRRIKAEKMILDLYDNGGFAISSLNGKTMIVESALGAVPTTKSSLLASNSPRSAKVKYSTPDGGRTFTAETSWGNISLKRTFRLRRGLLHWEEVWSNKGNTIAAVPFRHRIGLDNEKARIFLRGAGDVFEVQTLDGNSTIFVESNKNPGQGFGITLEDDISRLVCGGNSAFGMAELYTSTLAIAPKSSKKLFFTVTPVTSGGYWTFINALRDRWGIGKYGLDAPIFWAPLIPAMPGKNLEQRIAASLGTMGNIIVAPDPWVSSLRKHWVCKNPPPPGKSGEAMLRDAYINNIPGYIKRLQTFRNALPKARLMSLQHPLMSTVYLPEFKKSSHLANSALITKDGKIYHHAGFDSAILKGGEKHGWAVIYTVPRPGNEAWHRVFKSLDIALNAGVEAVYFDEFSTCATNRDYSRYDYQDWDGFSADIDENGKITALKSDNAFVTLQFQTALLHKLTAAGKIFLGNGPACTREMNISPAHRFTEGASSNANMPAGHLSHVPLVLGNFGKLDSRAGILEAVRTTLKYGCVYSPFSTVPLYLKGEDNFVSKLYPLTVTRIGENIICAKERFITAASGEFEWTGTDSGNAELFVYDKNGNRLAGQGSAAIRNGKIKLTVPSGGLVIAELK